MDKMVVDGHASPTGDKSDAGSGRRFDIKFQTKQQQFAIPDTVFHVPGGCQSSDLNLLVNSTLNESDGNVPAIDFDFLIEENLLRLSLEEHLEEIAAQREDFVFAERELVIEYFTKQQPPQPHDSLNHDDWVSAVAVQDNYVLSGCYDGTAQIWTTDGTHVVTVPAHPGYPVKAVCWISAAASYEKLDPKDKLFVTASQDEVIKVWQWSPHRENHVRCLLVCKGHNRTVNCVDVNVDLMASGSQDCFLKVWVLSPDGDDTKSKEGHKKQKNAEGDAVTVERPVPHSKAPLFTLSGHTEAITCLAWMSDKSSNVAAPEVATGSLDNTIRIWDVEVNEVKQKVIGSKAFLSLSYSPLRNAILSASSDRHVRLWDLRSKNEASVASAFTSHHGWVSSVRWSPENDILFVSGSYDNTVKYWDIRSPNAPLYDLMGHKDKVLCLDWSNSQFVVSGAADNMVKIFKMSN